LERLVRRVTEPHLLGADGRPNFGLKFYILNHDGDYAAVSLWGPTKFAVTDAQGTRLEDCEYLFEKPTVD
ncbi:MAG TPA: hypothetical protein VLA12_04865, partial [Planctomycetaceae bacterium]|nr:hypothetical protein [Planctomycetaceae bacterium]